MDTSGAPHGPAPVRQAPPRDTTPLPGGFGLAEDPSTRAFDGGTVLLGGSPLRMFRISERARTVVDRWRDGAAVGSRRGSQLFARRLVASGAFHPQPRGASAGPADVTVVVPVRDRPAQLDRLLGALAGLACVVVDDGSADAAATKEVAARHGAQFVGLAANTGPAGARNAGLGHADTRLVAFVDSDCVPASEWLEPLLGHFDDPLVAAVAPRIVPEPRVGATVIARYEAANSSLDRGPREGLVRPGSQIPFVPSAALLVRTGLVDGPDLFDPTLRGGEDVDLVWRLGAAGWDVRYVPSSVVRHDGASTALAFLGRRAFYGATAGPLARRHGRAVAPLQVNAWSVAVWLLAVGRRPVLALGAQVASAGILARRLRGLVRDPVAVAWHVAGGGTARSAAPAVSGLARAWAPALVLGLAFRRTRRASAAALLISAAHDRDRDRAPGGLDPLRYTALHVADDVAYGIGVWAGCIRERTVTPLLPRVAWRARVWSAGSLRRSLGPERQPG